EIGARAEVVAEAGAADHDPVAVLALWVLDLELGEDRVVAEVAQREALLAAELPAQLNLPGLQGHVVRLLQTRELGGPPCGFARLPPGAAGLLPLGYGRRRHEESPWSENCLAVAELVRAGSSCRFSKQHSGGRQPSPEDARSAEGSRRGQQDRL